MDVERPDGEPVDDRSAARPPPAPPIPPPPVLGAPPTPPPWNESERDVEREALRRKPATISCAVARAPLCDAGAASPPSPPGATD